MAEPATELTTMNASGPKEVTEEGDAFLRNGPGKKEKESGGIAACCRSAHTSR